MDDDDDDDDDNNKSAELQKKALPLSRSLIVGICAGVTLIVCLSVGMVLLCRHVLRQRKLRMEFEDDLESCKKK